MILLILSNVLTLLLYKTITLQLYMTITLLLYITITLPLHFLLVSFHCPLINFVNNTCLMHDFGENDLQRKTHE